MEKRPFDIFTRDNGFLNLPKRSIFLTCKELLEDKTDDKIIILYGLKSTGKSIILKQLSQYFKDNGAVRIVINSEDAFFLDVYEKIKELKNQGKKYFFIDEITLIEDFSLMLGKIIKLSSKDCRFILSGADSLAFVVNKNNDLSNNSHFIHTSFVPFLEWKEIIEKKNGLECNMDEYIKCCGVLNDFTLDNINLPEKHKRYLLNEEYIYTVIAKNIFNTLSKNFDGDLNILMNLYEEGKLPHAIMKIVQYELYRFIHPINYRYLKEDASSSLDILERHYDQINEITYGIVSKLDGFENENMPPLDNIQISEIEKYLFRIEIFKRYDIFTFTNDKIKLEKGNILTQHGLKYSQILNIIDTIKKFGDITEKEEDEIYSNNTSTLFKECILYNAIYELSDYDIFKIKYDIENDKFEKCEFDMIIYDKYNKAVEIFEIKYGKSLKCDWLRNFRNIDFLTLIEKHFGSIKGLNILYNGQDNSYILNNDQKNKNTNKINTVNLLNVNNFFNSIRIKKQKYNNLTLELKKLNIKFNYDDKIDTYSKGINNNIIDFVDIPNIYLHDILYTAPKHIIFIQKFLNKVVCLSLVCQGILDKFVSTIKTKFGKTKS